MVESQFCGIGFGVCGDGDGDEVEYLLLIVFLFQQDEGYVGQEWDVDLYEFVDYGVCEDVFVCVVVFCDYLCYQVLYDYECDGDEEYYLVQL